MIGIPVSNHQSQPPLQHQQQPPPPPPSSSVAPPPSQSIQLKPIVYFAKFQPQLQQKQQQQHHRAPPSSSSVLVYDASRDPGGDYHPQPSFVSINALPHTSQKLAQNYGNYAYKKFPSLVNQQASAGVITQSYYQAQRPLKRPTTFRYTPFLPSNKLPGKFVPMQQPSNLYHLDEDDNSMMYTRYGQQQPPPPPYVEQPIFVSTVK